jgi:hypothetical protein
MLHQKRFVGLFYCLCDDVAFNISAINKIVFKITVAAPYQDCSGSSVELEFHKFEVHTLLIKPEENS